LTSTPHSTPHDAGLYGAGGSPGRASTPSIPTFRPGRTIRSVGAFKAYSEGARAIPPRRGHRSQRGRSFDARLLRVSLDVTSGRRDRLPQHRPIPGLGPASSRNQVNRVKSRGTHRSCPPDPILYRQTIRSDSLNVNVNVSRVASRARPATGAKEQRSRLR
jgi:hypothetical protein